MAKTGNRSRVDGDRPGPSAFIEASRGPEDEGEPTAKIDPDKFRLSLPALPDKSAIRWDGFKSDKGRDQARAMIVNEAKALGMVMRQDTAATPGKAQPLSALGVCALVSMVSQGLAIKLTNCTPQQAAALGLTAEDAAIINQDGALDRVLEKYVGEFKYADELTVALGLITVGATKYAAFLQAIRTAPPVAAQATQARPIEQLDPLQNAA